MIELTIEGQVVPLKSHRPIFINSKTGRPFLGKDKRLRDYEKSAKEQIKYQFPFKPTECNVDVQFRYYVKDNRKRDLINLMETTQDILQGTVIKDDIQIKGYAGSQIMGIDKINPRTEILIAEIVK